MALETPPTGWLKCNGAAFSSEKYPNLAKTNKLPDLRGEFIRGWDDGRYLNTLFHRGNVVG
ncbi:phage tail protein [Escherichia coli]